VIRIALKTAFAIACCVGVLGVVATSASCARQDVNVGENDAAPVSPSVAATDGAVFPSGYGCANWVDSELTSLRGSTCTGGCMSSLGTLYALATQEELEAATAGQWLYCSLPPFGPRDAVGIEFAPGCRLYFLVMDAKGEISRGTLLDYQAAFDIYDLSMQSAPRRIDIKLRGDAGADSEDVFTYDVRASACPNVVQLLDAKGNVVVTLSSDFGDAGRPPQVVN
jgi:hypothetical protein